jgi:hypothetical protein
MATRYTTEYSAIIGGLSQSYAPLKPNQLEGRIRIASFTKTIDASNPVAIGDVVYATKLPMGARVILGSISVSALGTSATMSVGVIGSAVLFKAATSVAAATQFFFGQGVLETNIEISTANGQTIMLTAAGANYASGTIKGWVLYAID